MKYLHEFDPAKLLCIDIESISWDDKRKAFDWHNGHQISGVAIAQRVDGELIARYFPIRHRNEKTLDADEFLAEFREFARRCARVINFNIKFDLKFAHVDGIEFPNASIEDTAVLCRLHCCQEEGESLDYYTNKYNRVYKKEGDPIHDWCKKNHTLDYGAVPLQLMERYACLDVLSTYELHTIIATRMHRDEYDLRTWENEKKLTKILYEAECIGKHIDVVSLRVQSYTRMQNILECYSKIQEICGEDFNPGSPQQKREFFHTHGIHSPNLTLTGQKRVKDKLPVGPEHESFGKDTLQEIINEFEEDTEAENPAHLEDDKGYMGAAYWLVKYAKESHNYNTFCKGWLEAEVGGKLYIDFRQAGTRTGRMSMGFPSLHNYPPWAATSLLIPPGYIGIEWDAAQIEYRFFAHYAGQDFLYEAYAENPLLDFHALMAEKVGIPRKPAKTINFSILYGIGVGKLIRYLVGFITDPKNDSVELRQLLRRFNPNIPLEGALRAEDVEDVAKDIRSGFMRDNPGIDRIKTVINRSVFKRRIADMLGFITNILGRRYHFDPKKLYIALNYLCQGGSADWFKETMVLIFNDARLRDVGITGGNMITNIHDSVKAIIPAKFAQLYWDVCKEHAEREFLRVPIRIDGDICFNNFGNSYPILYDNIELSHFIYTGEAA